MQLECGRDLLLSRIQQYGVTVENQTILLMANLSLEVLPDT